MSRTLVQWTFTALLAALAAAPATAQHNDPPRLRYLEIRGPKGEMNKRGIFSHLNEAVLSPDGKTLAAGAGATVFLWNAADGKELLRIQLPDEQIYHRLAFSADGKTLAWCGREDPMIRIFDTKTGRQIREYRQPNESPRRGVKGEGFTSHFIAFSHDGKRMAFHGKNYFQGLDIFDVGTGKLVTSIADAKDCRGCDFSHDGKLIAGHSGDGDLRVWEVATGKLVREMKNNEGFRGGAFKFVTFSPDGKLLACGGHNHDGFDVWNLDTGKVICSVRSKNFFSSVSFAPDGQSAVCSQSGGKAYLYHLVAEKKILEFNPPERGGYYARFLQGGKRVVIIGEPTERDPNARQSSIYLYDVPPETLNPAGAQIDDATLEQMWAELPTDNELKLKRVQQAFRTAAKPAVELFKKKLPPITKEMQAKAQQWIAELDDDAPAKRDAATKELRAVAFTFEPLLRARREAAEAGEVRNRLAFILKQITSEGPPPGLVQELRALALLEQMATPEARALLTALSEGAPQARRTVEARAALERMGKAEPKPK